MIGKKIAYKSNGIITPRIFSHLPNKSHKLRHTYATNLMETTNDLNLLMEQLGHTSTSTSILYVHSTQEKAKRAAKEMNKRRNILKSRNN
ncbi:tyrosine-type recombinase/integrase [Bacillus sp. ISL-46]|uniref:tyrosine-type recombinase/integrase n=1 Tax=Bacillus sp. ISL-46 TaxID=2819129 RepID=UPI001BE5FE8F|nr:tyrosine-type recombinase/integrase [Bacillus sp. ISL-46]MBT2722689.1 tyrosine-type recombinase/integrase [Bacillus sp. ISL-46]